MRCLYCPKGDWSDYTTYQREDGPKVYVCKKHQPLTEKQIKKLEKKLDAS